MIGGADSTGMPPHVVEQIELQGLDSELSGQCITHAYRVKKLLMAPE